MTASPLTADGKHEKYEEIFCSVELTSRIHNQLIFLSVLNTVLSVTAFLGNTLILLALRKVTSLHPPSKLLYRNLAATDFCVGVIVEPLSITYLIAVITGRWNILGRPKLSQDRLLGQTSNLGPSDQSTESDQKVILAKRG